MVYWGSPTEILYEFLIHCCCTYIPTVSTLCDWTQYTNFWYPWILASQYDSVEITNQMQLCNRIYYSKVYWRLNMFRAAHRSSSGALNCICSLWFIHPCGDRLLSMLSGIIVQLSSWWWAICRSKHVEPSINVGIINSITRLHLVGCFYW